MWVRLGSMVSLLANGRSCLVSQSLSHDSALLRGTPLSNSHVRSRCARFTAEGDREAPWRRELERVEETMDVV